MVVNKTDNGAWLKAMVAAWLLGLPLTVPAGEGRGGAVYQQFCLACHGADGAGMMPGVPDFTEPNGTLTKPDSELLRNIITGIQSPGSPLAMPPKGGNPALTETQLMEALKYIRRTFGQ